MHFLQIETDLNKIAQDHEAIIDELAFQQLFAQRLRDPGIKINRGIERNFWTEKKSSTSIQTYHGKERKRAEEDLIELHKKLSVVQKKLKKKSTKTALTEEKRINNKIEKLGWLLKKDPRAPIVPYDERIYPLYYAGILVAQEKKLSITPMRLQIRPAGSTPDFDKSSPLYKAKKESLTARYFERIQYHAEKESIWQNLFGAKHGILVVQSFHEYDERHQAVGFSIGSPFLVPCLYDRWSNKKEELYSFAMITDAAPPDVAKAGYHRSPIALKPQYVRDWLFPQGKSNSQLHDILADNQDTLFKAA